jgi:type IV pilus assembly protein PilX
LIASLLLLVVVTILGVGMFRSFGIEEKIAGNTRDKQLALEAAESVEQYAEYWLMVQASNAASSSTPLATVACTGGPTPAVQIYSAPLPNPPPLTWPCGTAYTPPNDGVSGTPTLSTPPVFYIQYVQPVGRGFLYLIDSQATGGSANTVAEVEAYFQLTTINAQGG